MADIHAWRHYHFVAGVLVKCAGGAMCILYGALYPFNKDHSYWIHPVLGRHRLLSDGDLVESIRILDKEAQFYLMAFDTFGYKYISLPVAPDLENLAAVRNKLHGKLKKALCRQGPLAVGVYEPGPLYGPADTGSNVLDQSFFGRLQRSPEPIQAPQPPVATKDIPVQLMAPPVPLLQFRLSDLDRTRTDLTIDMRSRALAQAHDNFTRILNSPGPIDRPFMKLGIAPPPVADPHPISPFVNSPYLGTTPVPLDTDRLIIIRRKLIKHIRRARAWMKNYLIIPGNVNGSKPLLLYKSMGVRTLED